MPHHDEADRARLDDLCSTMPLAVKQCLCNVYEILTQSNLSLLVIGNINPYSAIFTKHLIPILASGIVNSTINGHGRQTKRVER